ncbi:hypothetical protein [Altererythrobacter sp. GH1-8]|uniref:hypothetical protein n=1 Tax=Altererythrobacter sp. GH1-8 TaxID=3349333 RepID=UPI00374CDFD1
MAQDVPAELRHAIAASLKETAHLIESLGTQLCADPHVVAEFLDCLQSIDLATQTLRCNAAVLVADCPVSAAREVKLQKLTSLLCAALLENAGERPLAG